MSSLYPIRHRSPFGTLMSDPFDAFFDMPPRMQPPKPVCSMLSTDILESEEGFELLMDVPGLSKEQIGVEIKEGYLGVSAQTVEEKSEEQGQGVCIRKERFSGSCSRRFYVGEDILEEDIKARLDNGVLKIFVPKKKPEPKLEEGRVISIEG